MPLLSRNTRRRLGTFPNNEENGKNCTPATSKVKKRQASSPIRRQLPSRSTKAVPGQSVPGTSNSASTPVTQKSSIRDKKLKEGKNAVSVKSKEKMKGKAAADGMSDVGSGMSESASVPVILDKASKENASSANPERCQKCKSCSTCFPHLKLDKIKAPNAKVKKQFKTLSRDTQLEILGTTFNQFHGKFGDYQEKNGKGLKLYGLDPNLTACVYCTHYGIKIKRDKSDGFHVFSQERFRSHYRAFHKQQLYCEFCRNPFNDKLKLLGHHTKKKGGCYEKYAEKYSKMKKAKNNEDSDMEAE